MLAGKDADADASDTGSTPLMMAAACGHLEVVKFLAEKGANINAQNDKTEKGQKCTALHFAVMNNKPDAAKVLASLGAKTDIPMNDGKTVDDLLEGNEELKKQVTKGKEAEGCVSGSFAGLSIGGAVSESSSASEESSAATDDSSEADDDSDA